MAAPVKVRVSEQEYLATMTGEKPSLEFVNGEVFQKPMVKEPHWIVVDEVLAAFRDLRRTAGGRSGPEGTVNLSEGPDRRYRVPDAAYWAPGKPRTGGVSVPPTAAVEVRSEGQTIESLRQKCREYLARGVDVCWIIDPERRLVELADGEHDFTLVAADGALESPYRPAFRLALADLWAALD